MAYPVPMATMRAAALESPGSLVLETRPVPDPGPGEILLAVEATTICGTDLRIESGAKTRGVTPGVVLGHEVAGRVAALGGALRPGAPAVGSQVGLAPEWVCGSCGPCACGRANVCENMRLFGTTVDGGLADYLLVPAPAVAQCVVAVERETDPALLALAGLALVSAGLINAQISAASPDSWGPMVAGALVIAVFVRRDTRSSNPLAELGLLRIPSFAAASLSLLALNVAISGIMFVLPAYVETALGNSALVGALMLMPMVVAAMVGAAITRKVSDRLGKRRACVASLVLIALGLAVMAASTAVAGYPLMIVGQCACGLGMAMGLPVMQGWAMERVPDRRRGGGSALVSTFQQLGCLIGIGALGSLVGSSYAAACRGTAAEGFASISLAFEAADAQSASQAHVVRAAASSAYAHAVLVAFCAAAVVLLVIAALAAFGSRSGAGER